MAAGTSYSNRYDATTGKPVAGRPLTRNSGPNDDFVALTFATTSIDDAGDVHYALPVASGSTIVYLDLSDFTDLDSGANLDMDVVCRTTSKAGAHTDDILFNAGAYFQAVQPVAGHSRRIWCNYKVPNSASGAGHLIFKVNVGAGAGAVQGTGNLFATVH